MRVLSVSTGRVEALLVPAPGGRHEQVPSGIRKSPVSTLADPRPIAVHTLGLDGDEQADHTVHGGRDKAVYAYPVEHYPVWRTIREQATTIDEPLPHGFFGENLTIEGLVETRTWIGDVLIFERGGTQTLRLRVDAPRGPCFKFNARIGFRQAAKLMVQSGYTGFYLEVLDTGTVAAGDTFRVVPGPREVSIAELSRLQNSRRRDL